MVHKFVYDASKSTLSAVDGDAAVRPARGLRGLRVTLIFAAIAVSLLGFGIAASGRDGAPPSAAGHP